MIVTPNTINSGIFYCEKKETLSDGTPTSLCAVHAANAFFGKKVVLTNELNSFIFQKYSSFFNGNKEQLKLFLGDINLISGGCNPELLQNYIVHLAIENLVPKNFETVVEKNMKVKDFLKKCNTDNVDRIIIFYNEHFITFRKYADGNWALIDDSLDKQISFENPFNFFLTNKINYNTNIAVISEKIFFEIQQLKP